MGYNFRKHEFKYKFKIAQINTDKCYVQDLQRIGSLITRDCNYF